MKNYTNGCISAVINEGTKEILSIQVSSSPNQQLIYKALKENILITLKLKISKC
ncbi:hypothetical protein [Apilactobacillus timberlakei]|uniref:hypothetical protein n=1 Tax=Apilactobacillus timberlakei TaxID=2008380 RepID=UPI0015E84D31|nr:hypothetical protein [Apilactobacillus timberlakei]